MGLTSRFGLTHFDDGVEGAFSDDNNKYTGRDRRVIDRIFAALELHNHTGGERLDDPEFVPQLTLNTTGGALRAGTTYYYIVTLLDRYGLETAPSEEVSVTTAAPVSSPPAPRVEAEPGGTLEVGLHWYAMTVFQDGNETALGPSAAISITDWNTVRIEAPNGLPAGTDAVSVWRQGPLDGGFTRLVTVPVSNPATPPDPLFTDDGSIESVCGPGCIPGPDLLPPDENLTNATNSVIIEIPPINPGDGIIAWRVYRTTESGIYENSLVAEVVETESELEGDLVNVYLDEGDTTFPSSPPPVSQTLTPSTGVQGGGGGAAAVSEGGYVTGQRAYSNRGLISAWLIHVQGSQLYTLDYDSDERLVVFDISERAWPRQIGSWVLGTGGYVAGLTGVGDKLYAVTIDGGASTLRVIDVSDPSSPSITATLPGLAAVSDGSVALSWPYVFAGVEDGVLVIDVSDPSDPTLVDTVALSTTTSPARLSRCSVREGSILVGHGTEVVLLQGAEGEYSVAAVQAVGTSLEAPAWVDDRSVIFDVAATPRLILLSSGLSELDALDVADETPFIDVSEGFVYLGHGGAHVIDARLDTLRLVAHHALPGSDTMADIMVRQGLLYLTAWDTDELAVFGALPHPMSGTSLHASTGVANAEGIVGTMEGTS